MGLFDSLKNTIARRQEEREKSLKEQREEDEALAKARHEVRMKSAMRVAELEEERRLKDIKNGTVDTGKGSGIWDKLVSAGQNVNKNMESGKFGMNASMGSNQFSMPKGKKMSDLFGNPFEQERIHHKKSQKHKKTGKSKLTGKTITVHVK